MKPVKLDYGRDDRGKPSLRTAAQDHPRTLFAAGSLLLIVMTLVAYSPAIRGTFIWDDNHHVTENATLRSFAGLQRIWTDPKATPQYYPMTHTSFWLEYRLWKLNPAGYHITNVLLHSASAILLCLLLNRLGVPGGWLAAAIFALHPVHSESVAWISERKNTLSCLFALGSLLVYLRYCGLTSTTISTKPKSWLALPDDPQRIYGLAILLFACALLSKSVTATLPAVIVVILWWKRGKVRWKEDLLPLLPFFALSIAMSAVTIYLERTRVGAYGPAWDFSPTLLGEISARTLIAGRAICFYLLKLLVPRPLIFFYPRCSIDVAQVWQWIFPLVVLIALIALWLGRNRIGRGPVAAGMIFCGVLFPALGFINTYPMQYSFVADHFQYHASIAVIVALAAGLAIAFRTLTDREMLNVAAAPAGALVLLFILGGLTFEQGYSYLNERSLWETTLKKTKMQSWPAANNYGVLLRSWGETESATRWFDHVIKLKPDHPQARYNLGLIAESRGDRKGAMSWFAESVKLDPKYLPARFKIAETLAREGKREEAIAGYREILEISPDDTPTLGNLAVLLSDADLKTEAIELFVRAIEIEPNDIRAHIGLGNTLASINKISEALAEYRTVAEIDPDNAIVRNNTGRILVGMGAWKDAETAFELAVKLDPAFTDAIVNLGRVHMYQGRFADAVKRFQQALKLNPKTERIEKYLAEAEEAVRTGKAPSTLPAATQLTSQPTTNPSN